MGQGLDRKSERASATIHPFKPRQPHAETGYELHFAFRVDNYHQLDRAFGPAAACQAVHEVVRIMTELVSDGGLVMNEGGGFISALVWERSLLGGGPIDEACAHFIYALSTTLALLPIRTERETVHISVSGSWCNLDGSGRSRDVSTLSGGAMAALARVPFPGEPAIADDEWARRYRCDMADVVELFEEIERGCVPLAWQPVRSSSSFSNVLYNECLLWPTGDNGERKSTSRLVLALERLGLIRPLDHHIVNRVIDQLEFYSAVVLGVNISAQSAVFDNWWDDIAERLARRPDVAARLVLEITETARFSSIGEANSFAARMRKLGCHIALDDFGSGHASIRQLLAFEPDIVKIDGFFLQRAELSDENRAAFNHLVGLATAMAPVVIVECAQTEALFEIARSAGAQWQQGHFLGEPTRVRTWRMGDDVARLEALREFRACFRAGRSTGSGGSES